MIDSNRNATLPLALSLLGGATLGAIALALSTPRSGKEVRTALGNLGGGWRSKVAAELDDGEGVAMFI